MSEPPAAVPAAYPDPLARLRWQALGNAGGFSGARLWRGRGENGQDYCLRAWPEGRTTADRLAFIHRLMDRARATHGLAFVPSVASCKAGSTWVEFAGRYWDLTTWLPGRADFREDPTDARLAAAVGAVARIHSAWLPTRPVHGVCPAVGRRLRAFSDWHDLLASGWHPVWGSVGEPQPLRETARHLWEKVPFAAKALAPALARWGGVDVPLQPCLCDVWHDHILFTGEAVTGVVDYGEVKVDCVAVDLSRLLGTLVPDQPERHVAALFAYGRAARLFHGADELVTVLDRTAVVVGAMNWLRWVYLERRVYDDWGRVASRMRELERRLAAGAVGF